MKPWAIILSVVIVILLISVIAANLLKDSATSTQNKIAVIPIYGTISLSNQGFFFDTSSTNSQTILDYIEQANEDTRVKAIILEINSGGGTVVASKEIADAVKESEKPVVAYIREVGASGAYWVASASDSIIADEMSVTGSIGVLGSFIEISQLMEDYGIKYEQLIGGKYKDVGSPFRSLTDEEKDLLQRKIDVIYDFFVSEVAKNRNLPKEDLKELATGMFYFGIEAKELGLIDHLGNKDTAIEVAESLAGIEDSSLITYKRKASLFDVLSKLSSTSFYFVGQGFGERFYANLKTDSQQFSFMASR
jgi:protease-4